MMADSKQYWVLIVEDDPEHIALLEAVFAYRDDKAHVTVTRSAEEAIACLMGPWQESDFQGGELPDVIVLDINMPGVGGLGFLKWYHEQPKIAHVPVVVFTSSGGPELERRSLALGASEFMVKPADFRKLLPVVRRALDRWVGQRANSA